MRHKRSYPCKYVRHYCGRLPRKATQSPSQRDSPIQGKAEIQGKLGWQTTDSRSRTPRKIVAANNLGSPRQTILQMRKSLPDQTCEPSFIFSAPRFDMCSQSDKSPHWAFFIFEHTIRKLIHPISPANWCISRRVPPELTEFLHKLPWKNCCTYRL